MKETPPPRTCSVDGCEKQAFSRGWCSQHYSRWQRHGDVNITLRQPPQTTGDFKRCPRCGNTKPMASFGTRPNGRPKGYCLDCEARYQDRYADTPTGRANRGRASTKWNAGNHAYFLNYRYGLSLDEYRRMLADQGGVCAICGTTEPGGRDKVWHVDHCHSSNKVRGLLCGLCNRGLGQFRDDPERLRAALKYLEAHRLL